jgi:spore germination protein (amino acid permease)
MQRKEEASLNRDQITSRQAFLILASLASTEVLRPSFRNFMLWAGNGGWLPILAAVVIGLILVGLIIRLAQRFPQQSIAEYAPRVWSPWLGYPLVIALAVAFFVQGTLSLRNVTEFVVAAILQETPISAVILVMLVLTASGTLAGLEGMVRFNELIFPVLIGTFFVILASTVQLNPWYLLPWLDQGIGKGVWDVFLDVVADITIVSYLLFIYPYLVDPENSKKAGRRYTLFGGGILFGTYLNTLLFLGHTAGSKFTWPYLTVTENIRLIERGEALFMVIWILAAFLRISFCFYIAALGLSQLIPGLKIAWMALASLPLAAFIALRAPNLPTALLLDEMVNRAFLCVGAGVPLFTLLLAWLRKMGGDSREQAPN